MFYFDYYHVSTLLVLLLLLEHGFFTNIAINTSTSYQMMAIFMSVIAKKCIKIFRRQIICSAR